MVKLAPACLRLLAKVSKQENDSNKWRGRIADPAHERHAKSSLCKTRAELEIAADTSNGVATSNFQLIFASPQSFAAPRQQLARLSPPVWSNRETESGLWPCANVRVSAAQLAPPPIERRCYLVRLCEFRDGEQRSAWIVDTVI
jgi:hypothetical protein